jgi:hypothetical protein
MPLFTSSGNPVYLILTMGTQRVWPLSRGCFILRVPDPTFAFVGGPCCPTLDFVIVVWIMITCYIVNFAILYCNLPFGIYPMYGSKDVSISVC